MKTCLSLLCLLFLTACAQTPVKISNCPDKSGNWTERSCFQVFPKGRWHFEHLIEARLPKLGQTSMLGVTELDSRAGSLSCVLMSLEGLVFFAAQKSKQGLKIDRAVPPFDSNSFAKGLLRDVRLIFLAPKGRLVKKGCTAKGFVCRYLQKNGNMQDIVLPKSNRQEWKISLYHQEELIRKVKALAQNLKSGQPKKFPGQILLQAKGSAGTYSLRLHLLSAKQLSD